MMILAFYISLSLRTYHRCDVQRKYVAPQDAHEILQLKLAKALNLSLFCALRPIHVSLSPRLAHA